jgi:hypothetical protein
MLLVAACCLLLTKARAQEQGPRIGCKNATILQKAANLKEDWKAQGFEVLNDAMLSMDSKEDFPVIVQMNQGEFYQIVFVGDNRATKVHLEAYDRSKKSIFNKTQKPMQDESEVISLSFTPAATDNYTFLLSQIKKKEQMCGSFTILKLKKAAGQK